MLCIIVVNAWRFFPFAIVIFLAGITSVPQDVIDAATVDGAGFWRRNYQIIMPMILPIVAIGLIFGIVFTFTDLSIVLSADQWRPGGQHIGVGFRGLPGRHRVRRRLPWRRHFAVHAAGAVRRGDRHAAVHPAHGRSDDEGEGCLQGRRRQARFYGSGRFFVVMTTFPFYWMVITSLKSNSDLYNVTNIPFWFNEPPTLEHFEYLFQQTLFTRWLWNSLVIGLCVTAITLVTAVPAGYSLARMTGRTGGKPWHRHFPHLSGAADAVVPAAVADRRGARPAELDVVAGAWSIPTFTIPFCTWLLMGFFKAIPPEIEEAAIVDGCSLFGAFIKMVIPLSVPAILTVIIFTFTLTLQEFVYALTFVSAADQKPITLGVTTDLVRGDVFFWGEIMAGALIASIPVAIAYNLFLDRFISGITGGAVK